MGKEQFKTKTEEFQLPDKIRKFIVYVDIYLDNFPHKYIQIKDRLANTSYDMLKAVYKANKTDNIYVKLDLIDELYADAQMMDHLINLSYEKKIINHKKVNKFGHTLGIITSMLTGWKRATLYEKQKQESKYVNDIRLQKMNVVKNVFEEDLEIVEEKQAKDIRKIENLKNKQLEEEYNKIKVDFPKPSF